MNANSSEYKLWLRGLEVGNTVAWQEGRKWKTAVVVERSDHGWLRLKGGLTVTRNGQLWMRGRRPRIYPKHCVPKPKRPTKAALLELAIELLGTTEKQLAKQYARAQ